MSEELYFARMPHRVIDAFAAGEITASMLTVMLLLYRWASFSTGRVKHTSARALASSCGGNWSERTVQDALHRLELQGYIVRENTPGSHKWYPVVIMNFIANVRHTDMGPGGEPKTDERGKRKFVQKSEMINPSEIKGWDGTKAVPLRGEYADSSDEPSDDPSDEPLDEPSDEGSDDLARKVQTIRDSNEKDERVRAEGRRCEKVEREGEGPRTEPSAPPRSRVTDDPPILQLSTITDPNDVLSCENDVCDASGVIDAGDIRRAFHYHFSPARNTKKKTHYYQQKGLSLWLIKNKLREMVEEVPCTYDMVENPWESIWDVKPEELDSSDESSPAPGPTQ